MKKITLLICLMLCGLFVVGGATASAAGKKPMDKEKAVNGLHDSFLFDKEELGELFDSGISYMELKKALPACLCSEKAGEGGGAAAR